MLGTNTPIQSPLTTHLKADVVIVGAGAAGLSAAMFFIDKGLKVVVLERNICGGSSSGKSAGFLTPDSELELSQLIRRFGVVGAKDLWSVPTHGIARMKDIIEAHSINCDFKVQDSLFLGIGKSGWDAIQEEMQAREQMGFDQTLYHSSELQNIIGSKEYSGAVRYANTYGIDALMYCQGVKKVLLEHNIAIYEATEVLSINNHTVHTHLGSVTADQIIFCIDKMEPALSRYAENTFHAQTFLSISEPLNDAMIHSVFPDQHFQCWDSTLMYSYFRLTGDNRILLGGGDMLTTFSKNDVVSPRVINGVIENFKEFFPQLNTLKFIQYWPGRIDCTRDLLPTILRDSTMPWIHFVLGCVGLPWATYCGDFAARHVYSTDTQTDHHYYQYFRPDRRFAVPLWLEPVLGKQIVFSLNNGWAKYFQKDIQKDNVVKDLVQHRQA